MGCCWSTPKFFGSPKSQKRLIEPQPSDAAKRDGGEAGGKTPVPTDQPAHEEEALRKSTSATQTAESQTSKEPTEKSSSPTPDAPAHELPKHEGDESEKTHSSVDTALSAPHNQTPPPDRSTFRAIQYAHPPSKMVIGGVNDIRQQCAMLATSLAQVSTLPPFLGPIDGTSVLDRGVPWPVEEYQNAFERSAWYREKVIAAWLAKWVYECIADDSIFAPEAAEDIRFLSSRPLFNRPSEAKEIRRDGIVYGRLVHVHGAYSALAQHPGNPAYDQLHRVFLDPIKAAFSEVLLSNEEVSAKIDYFGLCVWNQAMYLRARKGTVYATFHPERKDTEYYKRQRRPEVTSIEFHNSVKGYHYTNKELGGVAAFPDVPEPKPGLIIWYPEVTVEFTRYSTSSGGESIRIVQAQYTITY